MATGRRTWQQFEERAAAFFGSKRQVLSGSANRKDLDGSDSMHPRLHIEAKLREKHGVFRILDLARVAAMKAGWALQLKGIKVQKKVVLCLQEKGKPGFMVCAHSDDFREVVTEWLVAQSDETLLEIEHQVRQRRTDER
jgi:hypothetical protein